MTELTSTGINGTGSVGTGEATVGVGAGTGSPEVVGAPGNEVTTTPVYIDPTRLPEGTRSAPTLAKFMQNGQMDAVKLADSYRNLEALVGAGPDDLIRMPKNEEDWGKAYDRLGRPAKAEGYEIEKAPEDFKTFAHKLGLNQSQARAMWEQVATTTKTSAATRQEAQTKQTQANMAQLQNEWKGDFARNADIAHRAVAQFGGEELLDVLSKNPTMSNHPALVRAFHKIGMLASESNMLTMGAPSGTGGLSPQAAQEQIKALGNDQSFTSVLMDGKHKDNAEHKERWARLHEQAFPD
jgi:hypothetical protein